MHEILERALKQCEAAEVFSVKSKYTPVEFENNRLKGIQMSAQSGIALRVIKDGKVGFSSTTKPGDVQGLIDAAVATAEYGAAAEYAFPGKVQFAAVDNFDPAVPEIAVDSLVAAGEECIDALAAVHPKLLAGVSLGKSVNEVSILNSSGLSASHKSTRYSLSVFAEIIDGDNFLQVYEGAGGSTARLDIEAVKQRIVKKLNDGLRNASLSSGKYPVLMTPAALGDIVRPLMACADGSAVQKGFSPWKDKLDSQVTDARLRLYDDQTRPGSASSSPFDDEGTPKRRLPIIEDGILRNFLVDLKTASRLKKAPTGNGDRGSIETPPAIGTSTLVVDPGQVSLKQLLGGIKRGVIVDQMMGAWTGNPYSGAVNGNIALGFVVENGEIVGRIKDAMLSANAFEALSQSVVGISKEQIDYGHAVFPYMLLDGITILTKN